jgi:hypothetical protein
LHLHLITHPLYGLSAPRSVCSYANRKRYPAHPLLACIKGSGLPLFTES